MIDEGDITSNPLVTQWSFWQSPLAYNLQQVERQDRSWVSTCIAMGFTHMSVMSGPYPILVNNWWCNSVELWKSKVYTGDWCTYRETKNYFAWPWAAQLVHHRKVFHFARQAVINQIGPTNLCLTSQSHRPCPPFREWGGLQGTVYLLYCI